MTVPNCNSITSADRGYIISFSVPLNRSLPFSSCTAVTYLKAFLPHLYINSAITHCLCSVLCIRCFMMCVGSFRRTETPSEMTSCSFLKTAGEHIALSPACWSHRCIIQLQWTVLQSRCLFCIMCLQAWLHLRPFRACRQQKWRWDHEDGHGPTQAHRQLSIQGEAKAFMIYLLANDCIIVSSRRQQG